MESDKYLEQYLQQNLTSKQLLALEEVPDQVLAPILGEEDPGFFCHYYLPHYFQKPDSTMHTRLFQDIKTINESMGEGKLARASPRGSSKSTIVTLVQPLWNICYGKKKYIILIKDTFDQVKLDILSIKEELETNELLHNHFGILKGIKWGQSEIETSTGVLLQGLGAGMKIRGRRYKEHRPDLIVLDDIENDENTATPEQRDKLERWFDRAVLKAGDEHTDFFFIGTILHYDSLLAKILKRPAWRSKKYQAILQWAVNQHLWDRWNSIYTNIDDEDRVDKANKYYQEHQKMMLKGTQVLWPQKLDYYTLMCKRVDEGVESFDSEFQNEPITLEDALFRNIQYFDYQEKINEKDELETWLVPKGRGYPVKLKECELYMSCDPSLGKSRHSDYSAIIVVAKSPKNRLFTLEADLQRRHPNKIISDMFEIAIKYQATQGLSFTKLGVETVAFQEFFKDQVAEESQKANIYFNIEEIKNAGRHKDARIQSLEPDITNGYILLHPSQRLLIDQLRYFPKADHDDGPDALEMVRDLARESGWVIG